MSRKMRHISVPPSHVNEDSISLSPDAQKPAAQRSVIQQHSGVVYVIQIFFSSKTLFAMIPLRDESIKI